MTLDQLTTDIPVTVLGSRANTVEGRRRQAEMGIRSGAVLRILARTAGGGAILAIGDDRLAVSRAILRSVLVADTDTAARAADPSTAPSAAEVARG